MRILTGLLLGTLLAGRMVLADPALNLEVSAQKKQHQAGKVGGDLRPGGTAKGNENCAFEITIANNGLADTPPLEVKYVVFVQREQLGDKKGHDPTDRVEGSKSLDSIKTHAKAVVATEDITLTKSQLSGGWHYDDGGRINAKDSAKGIWVKVFQGETLVTEYSLPSTLKDHEKWSK